jgi:hypothetical protein
MAIQYSVAVRNARLDVVESTIDTDPILELRSGSKPANCAASDSGTLLASMTLPEDWMADAASGQKAKAGTWQDTSANASGTIGHFRIKDSTGTTCHIQGSVTITGGGGDMTVDNTSVTSGQEVSITGFTLTAGNA